MAILPAGYYFDQLPGGTVLIAPRGEVVSAFYGPDHPQTATIAAFHAIGYAHGRAALHRELRIAVAAAGSPHDRATALALIERALGRVQL